MRILHLLLPCLLSLGSYAQNNSEPTGLNIPLSTYSIDVDFMGADEHNQKDIMLGYNDILHSVKIDSNSNNFKLIMSGKKAINRVKVD